MTADKPTLQEILDRDGFVICGTVDEPQIGQVRTIDKPDDPAEGCQMRIIGIATEQEAEAQWTERGVWRGGSWPYFYKAVTE